MSPEQIKDAPPPAGGSASRIIGYISAKAEEEAAAVRDRAMLVAQRERDLARKKAEGCVECMLCAEVGPQRIFLFPLLVFGRIFRERRLKLPE